MAQTALEKYTTTYVQSIWKGYLARKLLKRLLRKRFLCTYLTFRFRWKRRSRASRVIQVVYRKYAIIQKFKQLVHQNMKCNVIQKAYRRRLFQTRAVIRFKAHKVWKHIEIFGMCKARLVLCPYLKEKRIICNFFLRFHRRMRARR
jgi:hypothetical protein